MLDGCNKLKCSTNFIHATTPLYPNRTWKSKFAALLLLKQSTQFRKTSWSGSISSVLPVQSIVDGTCFELLLLLYGPIVVMLENLNASKSASTCFTTTTMFRYLLVRLTMPRYILFLCHATHIHLITCSLLVLHSHKLPWPFPIARAIPKSHFLFHTTTTQAPSWLVMWMCLKPFMTLLWEETVLPAPSSSFKNPLILNFDSFIHCFFIGDVSFIHSLWVK